MKIGLDWDGTVNADPVAFGKVVEAFLDGGHDVVVTTWRCAPEAAEGWGSNGVWTDIEETFAMWGFRIPIVYCNGKAKRDCYPADIWIDDNPYAVSFSLTRPPRFEADPANYNEDVLVCERKGFEPIYVPFGQLTGKAL